MNIVFHDFLRISLLEQSSGINLTFTVGSNKNGRQNQLKTENWLFWSKFKPFDRPIDIEHKPIPKTYFNR